MSNLPTADELAPTTSRMKAAVERIAETVEAEKLPPGYRRAPESATRIMPGYSQVFVACGWPGPDPSADVVEFVLTLRIEPTSTRFETYIGTDQGDALSPLRESIHDAAFGSASWLHAFEAWIADARDDPVVARTIRSSLPGASD